MLKTTLVFEDGTTITSGAGETVAIRQMNLVQSVNSGTELTLGSVCAAMLEVDIIDPMEQLTPAAGCEVTLYRDQEQMGVFILEKPTRVSANILRLTAYDRVSLLDQDLTDWLSHLAGWPYSLSKFAWMVCAQCGLELENTQLPNGDYQIQKFSAEGITGRKLLSWVGQISGRYCIANAQGSISFGWYTPGTLDSWYYAGSLHFEDYAVEDIKRIQISMTGQDVGLVYPPDVQGNTYRIQGNYLLTGEEGRQAVAQTLLTQLQYFRYTPCKITLPASATARAGQILMIPDQNEIKMPFLVMTRTQTGQKDLLECTGSASRDSVSVVNSQSYEALSGRVLDLQTQVSGLWVENRDAQKNAASLQLEVEGIHAQVQQQEQNLKQLSQLEQTAQQLQLSVQTIQQQGTHKVVTTTGFTFDEKGLTVEKSGSDLRNTIDQSGMRVVRAGEKTMLRADAQGVLAADVSVDNYLIVGDHARFENYLGGRTACYYIGG